MFRYFTQTIPFSEIRHNDLPWYVREGYGGRPIEEFPPYSFFSRYLRGEEKPAREAFERWYVEQLNRYHATPKEFGGMHKGSLYLLVERRIGRPFAEAEEAEIRAAVRERVGERLSLLEHIREEGYSPHTERIDGVRKGGLVYLKGGHHRAAILRALGEAALPGVLVFPAPFVYNYFCFLRKIKYAFVSKQGRV